MMFPPRACTTTHGLHNYTQPVQPHTACTTTHSLYNHTQHAKQHTATAAGQTKAEVGGGGQWQRDRQTH